jgi:hypothetical protein
MEEKMDWKEIKKQLTEEGKIALAIIKAYEEESLLTAIGIGIKKIRKYAIKEAVEMEFGKTRRSK